MEFSVFMNAEEVEALFKSFPRKCKAALADGMDHATRSFYNKFLNERLQGRPGIQHKRGGIFHRFRRTIMVNGQPVFLRQQAKQSESTSKIAGSFDDPLNMSVEMYSSSKVAGIHETGGTISSGKAMPIPLNETAVTMLKSPAVVRSLELMKINGKLFLGRKKSFGRPELLFILVRGLRVRPRLGFYLTWERHASRREEIMDAALTTALEKMA